jgi:hypothetical protein
VQLTKTRAQSVELTEADVLTMRNGKALGKKLRTLATEFGCSITHVGAVCRGDAFPEIGGPRTGKTRVKGPKPQKVAPIILRERYLTGRALSQKDAQAALGCTKRASIARRRKIQQALEATGKLIERTLSFCGAPDPIRKCIPWLGPKKTKRWKSGGVERTAVSIVIYSADGRAAFDPRRILLGLVGRVPEPRERIQQACQACLNTEHMKLKADR